MSFIVVIPARYQSSRLPGKPLLEIAGRPMIEHVVERARQSEASAVYVATDDERIRDACHNAGIEVCMTSDQHQSGTDRIEEVARLLGLGEEEVIVNVQGDEPLMPPALINQVAANMRAHPEAGICTLYEPLCDRQQFHDADTVKLVTDAEGMALYFSRAPIPWPRDEAARGPQAEQEVLEGGRFKRHVGIYAYRVGCLRRFVQWPVSPLEGIEKLEQLRALYHGVRIHADQCSEDIPKGVDTEADLQYVRNIIEITC